MKVHHDAESSLDARHLAARAFTVGDHVFFGQGEFNPGTADGRSLLAHEAVHAARWTGAGEPPPGGPSHMAVSSASDREEIQAHDFAEDFRRDGAGTHARNFSPRPLGGPLKVFRQHAAVPAETGAQAGPTDNTDVEISATEEEAFDETADKPPSLFHSVAEGAAGVT